MRAQLLLKVGFDSRTGEPISALDGSSRVRRRRPAAAAAELGLDHLQRVHRPESTVLPALDKVCEPRAIGARPLATPPDVRRPAQESPAAWLLIAASAVTTRCEATSDVLMPSVCWGTWHPLIMKELQ